MKAKICLVLSIIPIFFLQAQEKTQMEKVMEIHDGLMENDMGKTVKLINNLETIFQKTSDDDYKMAIEDLKLANKKMVDWMQSFGQRFSYEEMYKGKILTTQKNVWLNEEKKKLLEMKKTISSSIIRAEKLLDKQ